PCVPFSSHFDFFFFTFTPILPLVLFFPFPHPLDRLCTTTPFATSAMSHPTSFDLTSHPHTSQLFSLPSIPHFFTITPYPLTCQAVQRSFSPAPHMKRRHPSSPANQQNHSVSNNEYASAPPVVNDVFTSQPPTEDQSIEGRVLKRMRRIKLNSDSPPLNSPVETLHASENDLVRINQHGSIQQAQDSHNYFPFGHSSRPLGPIKISTRSLVPQGSEASANQSAHESRSAVMIHENVPPDSDSTPTEYSGMNSILHRIHVARFGTPTELSSDEESSSSSMQVHRPPSPLSQEGVFATNTVWYQAQMAQTDNGQAMDEDDEMSDVVDSSDSSDYSFTTGSGQHSVASLDHIRDQESLVHGFPLSNAQRQQHNNMYEDINAKLRAAFLARAEIRRVG
ncbi:MAG: hypothetical protein J3Q66DRAFT_328688, partial [Benniella sp.]